MNDGLVLVAYRHGVAEKIIYSTAFSEREKLWREGYTVDALPLDIARVICTGHRSLSCLFYVSPICGADCEAKTAGR